MNREAIALNRAAQNKNPIMGKVAPSVIHRSHSMRLATMEGHLTGLDAAIAEFSSVVRAALPADAKPMLRRAVEAFEDRAAIVRGSVKTFKGMEKPVPLTAVSVVPLIAICLGIRDAGLGLSKWMWDLMKGLGLDTPDDRARWVWPIEDHLLELNIDLYWLDALKDRLAVDLSGKDRMRRLRARRRANMRPATINYHEGEVKTLELVGFLPLGGTHEKADVDVAMESFLALALEVANDAAAPAEPASSQDRRSTSLWRLRRWFFRLHKIIAKEAFDLDDWEELTGRAPTKEQRDKSYTIDFDR